MMTLRLSWLTHLGQASSRAKTSTASAWQSLIVYPLGFASCASLESKLEAKLHNAWIVHCRVHRAKVWRADIGKWVAPRIGETKLGVVEKVEKLRPEIQAHALARQCELLDD